MFLNCIIVLLFWLCLVWLCPWSPRSCRPTWSNGTTHGSTAWFWHGEKLLFSKCWKISVFCFYCMHLWMDILLVNFYSAPSSRRSHDAPAHDDGSAHDETSIYRASSNRNTRSTSKEHAQNHMQTLLKLTWKLQLSFFPYSDKYVS